VLAPLQDYLNREMNMKLRAEPTYGVTYEISTPAQNIDLVETESLEFNWQIESFRSLSGAAHLYDRRYSSETGALSSGNYEFGQATFMQIINTQFASGVQHTVFHGYSSIEGADQDPSASNPLFDGTYWPGHEGMYARFSERWGPRQPAYQHYGDYMTMIARNQAVLQQGQPQMDVAILRTDYHFNNSLRAYGDLLRNREGVYWKDMALQDAGYTYEYFAPENLELLEESGIRAYGDGALAPDGPAYQAVILYQDKIRIESAEKLLELAEQGLPVVVVNGATEAPIGNVDVTYPKAAVHTLSNDGRDAELAEVMAKVKALPNVKEVEGAAAALPALLELGVKPRAEFAEPNPNLLTVLRKAGDAEYLWAYNYMDETTGATEAVTETIKIAGEGKPYSINAWTGEIKEIGLYEVGGGVTSVPVTLQPGETTIVALDLADGGQGLHAVSTDAGAVLLEGGALSVVAYESGTYHTALSDGTAVETAVSAPASVALPEWDLTVESWDAGEKVEVKEDRGLGYETKEVYWTTVKTPIHVGVTALLPWKDIAAVGPEVSGVGTYKTTVTLPAGWDGSKQGAVLEIGSTNGNTAVVRVNGQQATGYDFVAGYVDVGPLLKPGANEIEVEVASTLLNRMKQRGYTDIAASAGPDPYGMTGEVSLRAYTVAPLAGGGEEPPAYEIKEITAGIAADPESLELSAGGAAYARFALVAGENVADVGTMNFRVSFPTGAVLDLGEGPEAEGVGIAEGLGGARLQFMKAPSAKPGYDTYSVYIFAAQGETITAAAGAKLATFQVPLSSAASPQSVTALLTHFDAVYYDAAYEGGAVGIDAKTAIFQGEAAQAISIVDKFDVNRDGKVTLADVNQVRQYLGESAAAGWSNDAARLSDIGGVGGAGPDGVVDLADLTLIIAAYEATVP
jgi:hypothetical protein